MKHTYLLAIMLCCVVGCDNTPTKPVFILSDEAATKVRPIMAAEPGCTHLAVFVDIDDRKYCTGFHYNLQVVANPPESRFVMTESNGIQLAIEKDDVMFLMGTTLDYAIRSTGEEGFVFLNPNANKSHSEEPGEQ